MSYLFQSNPQSDQVTAIKEVRKTKFIHEVSRAAQSNLNMYSVMENKTRISGLEMYNMLPFKFSPKKANMETEPLRLKL